MKEKRGFVPEMLIWRGSAVPEQKYPASFEVAWRR